jgi:hypothetical protein
MMYPLTAGPLSNIIRSTGRRVSRLREEPAMSKICIQCERKIGLFKAPIEGVYCSYDCRNLAREFIKESERESHQRIVSAQRRQLEEAAESERRAAVQQADAQRRGSCPKCSAQWSFGHAAGAGSHHASCKRCGFSADFVAIESCPVCKGQSLVVGADQEARCPRCKYRRHARSVAV